MHNRFGTAVRRWATALLVAGMGLVSSASGTLLDRGPDMVYDNVLNITWTRNANLCLTLGDCVNGTASGGMTWLDANTWAADLDYQGFPDWRLPYANVGAGAGPITTLTSGQPCTGAGGADEIACRDNEMAYMFYYNLDGVFLSPETGTQIGDGVTLNNIQPFYWSATSRNSFFMWEFDFNGFQVANGLLTPLSAWAVRPGDVAVAAVPEPASLLLFGLGALGLGWSRRSGRRR